MVKYVLYDENGNVVDESDKAFESEGTVSLGKQEPTLQEQPKQERQAPKYKGSSDLVTGATDLFEASVVDAMPFGIGHRLMGAAKAATSDIPYKQAVKEAKDYTKSVKDYHGYDHPGIEGFTKATSEWALSLRALQALPVVGPAISKWVNSTSLRHLAFSLGGLEATRKTAEVLSDVVPSQGRGITGSDVVNALAQGAVSGARDTALLGLGGKLGVAKAAPFALGIGAVEAPVTAALQGREATLSDYLTSMGSNLLQSSFAGLSKPKAGTGVKGSPEVKDIDRYKKLANRSDELPLLEFTENAVPDDVKLLYANTDTNKYALDAMRKVDSKAVQKLAKPFAKGIKDLSDDIDNRLVSELGITKESILSQLDDAEKQLAAAKAEVLSNRPIVTEQQIRTSVDDAAKVNGWSKDKADGVYDSIMGAYNRASKEGYKRSPALVSVDTGETTTAVVNGVQKQVPVTQEGLRTEVLMDAKRMLSELSKEKQLADTNEAFKVIRDVYGPLGEELAKADAVYSLIKSMDDASGVAARQAADVLDIDMLRKIYGEKGAKAGISAKARWAVKGGEPTNIRNFLGKESQLLSDDLVREIDRLDYMKTANKLVRAKEGINFDDFMIGEKGQRAAAGVQLGPNFATYMATALGLASGKRHIDKKAVKSVIDMMSKLTVGEAKPLLNAGHGNIWTDSMLGDIVEGIIKKLPKKGGK